MLLLVWIFPLFLLIETRNLVWVSVSMVVFGAFLCFSYGPLPALYAEFFPARIRLSGSSISYALGSVVDGAFAPTIAVALVGKFDATVAVSTYLSIWVGASLIATLTLKDRTGANSYPHDRACSGERARMQGRNNSEWLWRPAPAHRTEAGPSSPGRTYCQPQCAIRLAHMHPWSALQIRFCFAQDLTGQRSDFSLSKEDELGQVQQWIAFGPAEVDMRHDLILVPDGHGQCGNGC